MNSLERLRIMHDLIKTQNFEAIPRDEIVQDLEVEIRKLQENFQKLLDQ